MCPQTAACIFQVRRTDGTWHPAEVIHRRLITESDTAAPAATAGAVSGGGAPPAKVKKTEEDDTSLPLPPPPDKGGDEDGDKYEYYVHYSGFNRRLDEWVRRDRVKHTDEDVRDVSGASVHLRNI